ncbi:hypothetical protein AGMMS49579_01380 [Spirochaetia bacterium]|nr:hypothetical protein AGMMS49579_01380 [Spirochaetia bacterium]
MDKKKCEKWFQNPTVNPETNRKIKVGGAVYKRLEKECGKVPKPKPPIGAILTPPRSPPLKSPGSRRSRPRSRSPTPSRESRSRSPTPSRESRSRSPTPSRKPRPRSPSPRPISPVIRPRSPTPPRRPTSPQRPKSPTPPRISDDCLKWLKNPTVNPETNRKIKVGGAIYKKLEKKCGSPIPIGAILTPPPTIKPQVSTVDECEEWLKNPEINPETNRKIKVGGAVYKRLEKECGSPDDESVTSVIGIFPQNELELRTKKELLSLAKDLNIKTKPSMDKLTIINNITAFNQPSFLTKEILMKLSDNELRKIAKNLYIVLPFKTPRKDLIKFILTEKDKILPDDSDLESTTSEETSIVSKSSSRSSKEPSTVPVSKQSFSRSSTSRSSKETSTVPVSKQSFSQSSTAPSTSRSSKEQSSFEDISKKSFSRSSSRSSEELSKKPSIPISRKSDLISDTSFSDVDSVDSSKADSTTLFPSIDSSKADSTTLYPIELLKIKANQLGYEVVDTPTDGNCLFHVLGNVFNMSFAEMRQFLTSYMINNAELKQRFIDTFTDSGSDPASKWDTYINNMVQNGCWGDGYVLTAATEVLEFEAFILRPQQDDFYTYGDKSFGNRNVYIGYIDEQHFTNLKRIGQPLIKLSIPRNVALQLEPEQPKPLLISTEKELSKFTHLINNLRPSVLDNLNTISNTESKLLHCIGLA